MGYFWIMIYNKPERHKRMKSSEIDYIKSDGDEVVNNDSNDGKQPWLQLLLYRQSWSYILAKFLTEPAWWFYLGWLPKFLIRSLALI